MKYPAGPRGAATHSVIIDGPIQYDAAYFGTNIPKFRQKLLYPYSGFKSKP
jgi:hypothetical protein